MPFPIPPYAFGNPAAMGATPFVPTNIAGCVLWLNASQIVGADGDAVANWNDLSGNANDAVQAVALIQPVLKKNILNGKAVVRFDGTDGLVSPSVDVASWTLIAVYNTANATLAQRALSTSTNSLIGPFGAGGIELFDGDFSSGPAAVNGTFVVHTGIHTSGVGGTNFVNGGAQGTTIGTQSLGTAIGVGATSISTGGFLTGDIAEVVAYNTALSGANRALVESYLLSKYALP